MVYLHIIHPLDLEFYTRVKWSSTPLYSIIPCPPSPTTTIKQKHLLPSSMFSCIQHHHEHHKLIKHHQQQLVNLNKIIHFLKSQKRAPIVHKKEKKRKEKEGSYWLKSIFGSTRIYKNDNFDQKKYKNYNK